MKSVNIILSTYNGEKYLGILLESILNNNYPKFTLNVCDDGSSDSTEAIVMEYQEKYPEKIRFFKNEKNLGSTMSFLKNLKMINKQYSSDYYMFCDQDDVWLNDKITLAVRSIKRLEHRRGAFRPAMVFFDAIIVNDDLEYISRSFYRTNRLKVHKTDIGRMLIENKCIGCTMLMNRALVSMVDKLGNEIRYHDWWIALIASSFGVLKYNRVPTILYRQHADNQVGQTEYGSYVKKRASDSDDIKRRLEETFDQAEFFLKVYSDRLPKIKRKRIERFVKIRSAGFFRRRFMIIKNRFFKSGFLRNVGLMFYI